MRPLSRLLNPRHIAVIGGGAWGEAIIGAAQRLGYDGRIVPVNPKGKPVAGIAALRRLEDWQGPLDGAFVGVNRHATLEVVTQLRAMGAGGAICFASGFREAQAEDDTAQDLQAALVTAAGEMPILGPNCYGFVNALDRVAIWPDQHGMTPVERGVAILTQSSNIALNLSMQQRGLPVAMVLTCGNAAQQPQARIARALLEDPRITAIGLHIEGFGDLRDWEALASEAYQRGVPLVALKVGRSAQARAATVSHTASLAGEDAGAEALLRRLGIARASALSPFLEALKLLHFEGPLAAPTLASISCSGGEASLVADLALPLGLTFPGLQTAQVAGLRAALGSMVALANPLDYHTYIWRDGARMSAAWSAMAQGEAAATLSVVDFPSTDRSDWDCTIEAAIAARAASGKPFVVASSLPELMPQDVAQDLLAGGVVPIGGLDEALGAVALAAAGGAPDPAPLLLPNRMPGVETLTEAEAKQHLAGFGVPVPRGRVMTKDQIDLSGLHGPFALKGQGLAHKSELGAVRLNLRAQDVPAAAQQMPVAELLVEEMIPGSGVELLVGVSCDPAHGFLLTLGAGGTLTEVLEDTASLLVPATRTQIEAALHTLRLAPLLSGYRGQPGVDLRAVLDTIMAVQAFVTARAGVMCELEINPLICTQTGAVAADALIRLSEPLST